MAESIASQWKKLQKNLRNAAYRQSEGAIKAQAMRMCEIIASEIDIYGKGVAGMTGNAAAGIAVGAYRDGALIGYATTAEAMGKPPIRAILRKGDKFQKGRIRWDDEIQEKTEHSNNPSRFYANKKAVQILQKAKMPYEGFSFMVVSAVPYGKYIEGRGGNLISNFYAELRQAGAHKIVFHG